ncbi:MAG TPA: C-type lectin domain-containing protein [Kofleriaceae bacterium]|nr:C-type lectin domain-containing protein [Kofleriaceae bacterium]
MGGRLVALVLACGCSFRHGANADGAPARDDAVTAQKDGRTPDSAEPLDGMPPADSALPCPSSYTVSDSGHPSSLYRVVTASAEWAQAESNCEADAHAGTAPAHLIVPDDQAELTFAENQISGSNEWVGVSDQVTEATFLAVTDQTAFDFTPTGNNPGLDCGELGLFNSTITTQVTNCQQGNPYLCECDGRAADSSHF